MVDLILYVLTKLLSYLNLLLPHFFLTVVESGIVTTLILGKKQDFFCICSKLEWCTTFCVKYCFYLSVKQYLTLTFCSYCSVTSYIQIKYCYVSEQDTYLLVGLKNHRWILPLCRVHFTDQSCVHFSRTSDQFFCWGLTGNNF